MAIWRRVLFLYRVLSRHITIRTKTLDDFVLQLKRGEAAQLTVQPIEVSVLDNNICSRQFLVVFLSRTWYGRPIELRYCGYPGGPLCQDGEVMFRAAKETLRRARDYTAIISWRLKLLGASIEAKSIPPKGGLLQAVGEADALGKPHAVF